MLIQLLLAATALHVDPDAKFNATFDAPLGERINAVSSAVGCDLTYDDKAGLASGACSVPLTSIMVDNEPTKTEHFQQWATNKKVDPKECKLEAKFDGLKVGTLSDKPAQFQGEVPFTICGKSAKPEHLTGNAMQLADGRVRIRARVAKFNRDKYKIGPKYTEGWLSRVQQLAPVVAETGELEISVFAKAVTPKEAAK